MLTAEQAIELKARIKAEMLRRDGHGSLTTYANSSYDFIKAPKKGNKIQVETGQKTVDLLLKIGDYKDLTLSEQYKQIPSAFADELFEELDRLASETKTGLSTEVSSCRGDCSGLCVASCIGQCNGCTGCTASCGTGCASGCNSTCDTGCSETCTGSCTGNCTGSCYTGCSTGCQTACTGATAATKK